ncbi:ribulokinase [Fulvivirgaceae bacterium BMA12]|uniref:Ribulokinase n=1 Tax=Agaribacillus aureus TaxID=3051825 RepID=A0ABT8LFX6_9BACT|nr:ribulokinase [Fulvivirgaceae bacterium BMA12]
MKNLVLGIDFGTDSVRVIVVNAIDGKELATAVCDYNRWAAGAFCDPVKNQFRQHPLDYIEGLEKAVKAALDKLGPEDVVNIAGISVDTTGSTPVAVNKKGIPLALLPGFEENPNAMFVLWKDHTAVKEAEEINRLARVSNTDYTKFVGGIYSSEWFWAKILHILRVDPAVRENAYSWVEHCDWIPYLLTGQTEVRKLKRSRCAAGHKAMWHAEFDGLPAEDFLHALDPLLDGLRSRLYNETYTSDQAAGTISPEWASKLGLPQDVIIGVGAFDAHMGAVGGQIENYHLSKVMGTSTCDMLIAPSEEIGDKLIRGICGQVDGSIIPGTLGMEAGQSAFGDIYAWFARLLGWPLDHVVNEIDWLDPIQKQQLLRDTMNHMIPVLSREAAKLPVQTSGPVAVDWLNGRRTPDADQRLKGALMGLNLGTDAVTIFKALVEATCFGAKEIVERFVMEGVPIEGIIALGGVAKKSSFIMQTMADVLNKPIKVARSEQTCALGAAMFAATIAGIHPSVEVAKEQMGAGFEQTYQPQPENVEKYNTLYQRYKTLGKFIENENRNIATYPVTTDE